MTTHDLIARLHNHGKTLTDDASLIAEAIAVIETLKRERDEAVATADALHDSAYIAGLQAGWNFGVADDAVGMQKCISARDGYLKPIREKQRAAISTLTKPADRGNT